MMKVIIYSTRNK